MKEQTKTLKRFDVKGITQVTQTRYALTDTAYTYTDVDYDRNYSCINKIVQGNEYYKRIGNKVNVNRITLDLHFTNEDEGTFSYANVRCVLLYDKQTNGSAPAINGTIFDSVYDSTSAILPYYYSPYSYSNSQRFEILYDKYFTLSEGNNMIYNYTIDLNDLNLETVYQSNTNNISEIATGGIYLIISGTTEATTAACIVVKHSQIYFYDK